jgi:hypothetical protein
MDQLLRAVAPNCSQLILQCMVGNTTMSGFDCCAKIFDPVPYFTAQGNALLNVIVFLFIVRPSSDEQFLQAILRQSNNFFDKILLLVLKISWNNHVSRFSIHTKYHFIAILLYLFIAILLVKIACPTRALGRR